MVGILLFPVFCWYESTYPENPIIPYRFLRNTSILGACLIGEPKDASILRSFHAADLVDLLGFFDFVSFYLQFTNLYNFIYVTQDWSPRNLSYFASIQTMAMTIFGIIGGAIMSRTRDVKVTRVDENVKTSRGQGLTLYEPRQQTQFLLLVGLIIRLGGVALMIHSRGANGTAMELVLNQALQGIGGGFASVTLQVSAQAGVSHAEVATVIAMVMLITEVGNSVGSASTCFSISGAWYCELISLP
jgi:MFS family permease